MPTRAVAMVVLAVASVVTAFLWAPSPLGRTDSWYGHRDNVFAVAARELLADIPDDAVVSANYRLTPHLAHRERDLPVPGSVPGDRCTDPTSASRDHVSTIAPSVSST